MWALLSDPGHAASFGPLGEEYAPLRRLVERLARREYAGRVHGFTSLASFNLTTAPSYPSDGHDVVGIDYYPRRGLFTVGYFEWVSPTRNPPCRSAAGRTCEAGEVGEVVDRYVLRLVLLAATDGSAASAQPE